MVDTVRTLAALQVLLADNVAGDIGAQDVRDFLVSVWGTVQIGHAERSLSVQAIGTGAFAAISFDVEVIDNDSMVDIAGAPTRVTATTAGTYQLNAAMTMEANATGARTLRIFKNGATELARVSNDGFTGAGNSLSVSVIDEAAATDYYEAEVFQDSGGDLDLLAFVSNFLSAYRIDPLPGQGA